MGSTTAAATRALAVTGTARVPTLIKERHNMQGLVDRRLYQAVRQELIREGRSVAQLLNWACREYLYQANPTRAAEEFGIVAFTPPEP